MALVKSEIINGGKVSIYDDYLLPPEKIEEQLKIISDICYSIQIKKFLREQEEQRTKEKMQKKS